ncbi:hypothetical protein D3C72_2359340 [compost metagenome]
MEQDGIGLAIGAAAIDEDRHFTEVAGCHKVRGALGPGRIQRNGLVAVRGGSQ